MSSNSALGRGTPGTASLVAGEMAVNARQVGGGHYSGSSYQHWDWATDLCMRATEYGLSKYLARAGNKASAPRELDLEKAVHFAEKTLELYGAGRLPTLFEHQTALGTLGLFRFDSAILTAKFIELSLKGAAFTPRIVAVMSVLASWKTREDLDYILATVREEYKEERRKPKAAENLVRVVLDDEQVATLSKAGWTLATDGTLAAAPNTRLELADRPA